MTKTLIVAVVQFTPVEGDVLGNIERSERIVRDALERGARLIVFPELSLTGYHLDFAEGEWFVPGDDRLHGLRHLVADAHALVVVGAPVVAGDDRHLASLILSIGEDVIASKMHLDGKKEVEIFVPGVDFVVLRFANRRLGFGVCFDTAFGSHAEAIGAAGADIYVTSVLYTAGEERKQDVRMAMRAIDTGMVVVAANLGGHPLGERSAGGSGVWDATGTLLGSAESRDQEVVFVTLPEEQKQTS